MPYIPTVEDGLFSIDAEAAKDLGKELQEAHNSAAPFPHTVIDDFLPRRVIDECLQRFPTKMDPKALDFDRDQERLKTSFNPDYMDASLRALFYTFNSRPFVRVIENITGIPGLIPDPYFVGAGFHEIKTGGHLSVHIDFNHHKPMNLERRVNLLIYLNDDWEADHGGQLEFWDETMSECVQSVVPLANRAAMFTLSDKSYHGNPTVVNHPNGQPRRSIALYYYTATWDGAERSYTTQFKQRKGTADKADWNVRSKELVDEFLPPVLARPTNKVVRKLFRKKDKSA